MKDQSSPHNRPPQDAPNRSDKQYPNLFDRTPCAILIEDCSKIAQWLDGLRAEGVTDIRQYLSSNSHEVKKAFTMIEILDVNDAAVKMYQADSKQQVIDHIGDTFSDEAIGSFVVALEDVWHGRDTGTMDFSGVTFKGRPMEFISEWSAETVDGKTDFTRVVVAHHDITERKQTERALQKSEERYRSLFQDSGDAIFLLNTTNDTIFDANEQSCKLLGYNLPELTSMTIWDLHPKDEHPRANQLKQKAFSKGSFHGAEGIHFKHRNGTLIPVSVTATIIESDQFPIGLVHARDITEKKLAEQALTESEERFRSLVRNIPGTVYRCQTDHPWQVEHVSESVLDLTGYPAADFMDNNTYNFADMILQEDMDDVISVIVRAVAGHEPFGVECRIRHNNGTIRWVHGNGIAIYDKNDQPKWLDGVIFDITERKESEMDRERLLSRLASKNEELQSIVYVASHDLKTPLVNIQGFSGELAKTCEQIKSIVQNNNTSPQLKEKLQPLIHEDIPEALHFIQAGSSKMQSLLDGLLAVSRVGNATFEIEDLNMNAMIRGVIASMQFQITRSGTELNIHDLPPCRGDNDYLNQVFSNLVANAVKYLHPDRKGKIDISGQVLNGDSVYCIADNGIGIAPENQQKVFEIFHRLESNGPVKGEGLGLTIAQRILERHGGRIHIESEPDNGSRFFVTLPT